MLLYLCQSRSAYPRMLSLSSEHLCLTASSCVCRRASHLSGQCENAAFRNATGPAHVRQARATGIHRLGAMPSRSSVCRKDPALLCPIYQPQLFHCGRKCTLYLWAALMRRCIRKRWVSHPSSQHWHRDLSPTRLHREVGGAYCRWKALIASWQILKISGVATSNCFAQQFLLEMRCLNTGSSVTFSVAHFLFMPFGSQCLCSYCTTSSGSGNEAVMPSESAHPSVARTAVGSNSSPFGKF